MRLALLLSVSLFASTTAPTSSASGAESTAPAPYLVVLGIAQDGGAPQAGYPAEPGWHDPTKRRLATSLALVDPASGGRWLFDATPDFPEQLQRLDEIAPSQGSRPGLSGIFLTHAHIGHYAGLMYLGKEVIGAKDLPVYAMPRMSRFLTDNGPWQQLVLLHNIVLKPLAALASLFAALASLLAARSLRRQAESSASALVVAESSRARCLASCLLCCSCVEASRERSRVDSASASEARRDCGGLFD